MRGRIKKSIQSIKFLRKAEEDRAQAEMTRAENEGLKRGDV